MMQRTGRMACALLACAVLAGAAGAAAATPPASAARTPYELRAREIFARVIGFHTEVGRGEVPALAGYLSGLVRDAGFPAADIQFLPLGETGSLVVRYRGDGSGGKPILALSHMDVVTARREEWQRDPYTLIEENGYFFGRGTLDVKGGLVCQLMAFLRLRAEGFVPSRDLVLVITGDEETTEDTTADLVKNHRDLLDADFALNADAGNATLDEASGRPLFLSIGTAEKTYADFELTAHNPGGHSMSPRADNAIYDLSAALLRIQAYHFPVMWNATTLGYFRGIGALTPGELGQAMLRFGADPHDGAAVAILETRPNYAGMIRTTCVPTLLRGGHAANALPESAIATLNCRIFPGIDPVAVRDTLQGLAGPGIEVTTLGKPIWTSASPLRDDVLEAVTRAVRMRNPGVPVVPWQESGLSDAAFFRAAGIPTYGVHAAFFKFSDDFQHGLNERVPVKSFYDYLDYWYRLLKNLSGPRDRH
jgi:acetylornithine deacetylase/succinyl-diaminopimelate desuccinylase-like protein